jgi:hypothetical protein
MILLSYCKKGNCAWTYMNVSLFPPIFKFTYEDVLAKRDYWYNRVVKGMVGSPRRGSGWQHGNNLHFLMEWPKRGVRDSLVATWLE